MYTLHNTFIDRPISRHRTLLNAVRAKRKHYRAVKRLNGDNAYVPYKITLDDEPVQWNEVIVAEWTLDQQ